MISPVLRSIIIEYVSANVKTFGGGRSDNIIAAALADKPPTFALGVEVGEVVDLVFEAIEQAREANQQLGESLEQFPLTEKQLASRDLSTGGSQ